MFADSRLNTSCSPLRKKSGGLDQDLHNRYEMKAQNFLYHE